MSTRTSAKPLRLAHRIAAVIRSLRPATSIAIGLAVFLGGTVLGGTLLLAGTLLSGTGTGTGIADAAATAGRAFILGRSNAETATAKLSDSRGTPLSLSAPRNKPPLAVNRSVMVKNLNAQYVGGLGTSSVKFTGGDGIAAPNADVALEHDTNVQVAGTGPLPAGTYYVTATALIDLTVGDYEGQCSIFKNHGYAGVFGGGDGSNYVQAAESAAIQLTSGSTLQEYCDVDGTGDGSEAIDGSIIAIRILTSSGTKPSATGVQNRR